MTRAELIGRVAKLDAKDSAFLDLQLQSVETQIYRKEYPALKARSFIPLKADVPGGAESFAYYVFDVFGQADWASNYSDELPPQGIRGEKVTGKVEGIVDSYGYSSQDLRAAAMANMPLDAELAQAAMERIEFKVDATAALGDKSKGFIGMARHPNVDILQATGTWASQTGDVILADLHRLAGYAFVQTKELFPADTMLLDTASYDLISTKPVNTSGVEGRTVLSAFLASNPHVKSVQSWTKLGTASDAGGKRAICYKRDSRVLQLVIPLETQTHEPQRRGLRYVIPLEMRFGGVIVRQPKAITYMDGM